jgi:hypothetical protein
MADKLDLDEAERICEGAHEGPWRWREERTRMHLIGPFCPGPFADISMPMEARYREDANFITFSRTFIPQAIARIRELEQWHADVIEANKSYAGRASDAALRIAQLEAENNFYYQPIQFIEDDGETLRVIRYEGGDILSGEKPGWCIDEENTLESWTDLKIRIAQLETVALAAEAEELAYAKSKITAYIDPGELDRLTVVKIEALKAAGFLQEVMP